MTSEIKTTFTIDSWDETVISESEKGPVLKRAHVQQHYSGAFNAKSTIEYLMTTFEDGTSLFIGIENVHGELEGKTGSFLINHTGTHENGVAASDFEIIPKSGTGELKGISGSGRYKATHESAESTFTYRIEDDSNDS